MAGKGKLMLCSVSHVFVSSKHSLQAQPDGSKMIGNLVLFAHPSVDVLAIWFYPLVI